MYGNSKPLRRSSYSFGKLYTEQFRQAKHCDPGESTSMAYAKDASYLNLLIICSYIAPMLDRSGHLPLSTQALSTVDL